ncbi:MAG: restriction endonuclease subunit S [Clostridia bacterium]
MNDVIFYEQPSKYIVESTNYSDAYNTPVLTAGKSFILGYTNETKGIFSKVPAIIFDDFTTESKYVDFNFKVKSSAMKILNCSNLMNIKFIYYLLQVINIDASTHKRHWISNYEYMIIPIPSKKEQDRIVTKIEELFKQVESINKHYNRINKLKKLLKSKIIDMAIKGELTKQISTDKPASELIEDILEEKRKLIKEGKIKKENLSVIYKDSTDNQFYEKFDDGKIINITKEIPYDIPINWTWTRIRNLGELLSGYAYKSNMYIKKSNNLVIRLGNVKNDKIICNAHPVYINNVLANETQKYLIKENDILITMTGTRHKRDYFYTKLVDKKDIINYNLYLNQRVGNFKCNSNMNLDYLIKILKSKVILDQVFSKETGTANQGNIGTDAILNILVPIPPIKEQNKISKILIMINNTIKTAE